MKIVKTRKTGLGKRANYYSLIIKNTSAFKCISCSLNDVKILAILFHVNSVVDPELFLDWSEPDPDLFYQKSLSFGNFFTMTLSNSLLFIHAFSLKTASSIPPFWVFLGTDPGLDPEPDP
jgi:hypothetical protein